MGLNVSTILVLVLVIVEVKLGFGCIRGDDYRFAARSVACCFVQCVRFVVGCWFAVSLCVTVSFDELVQC